MLRKNIKDLRPDIASITKADGTKQVELFQNEVLRPILKYQNNLLLKVYQQYLKIHKVKVSNKSESELTAIVHNSFEKDKNLRNFILGLIIGLLTSEEYDLFKSSEKEYKKRIINMSRDRILDQL
jgi:ATP-dependent protease Clp ATPase subunit